MSMSPKLGWEGQAIIKILSLNKRFYGHVLLEKVSNSESLRGGLGEQLIRVIEQRLDPSLVQART